MSQENVESFQRGTEAYNRRDVDALLTELDPDVEWHSALLIPFGGEATVSRDTTASVRFSVRCMRLSPISTSTTRRSGTWAIESSESAGSAHGESTAGGD